jgi:hypothetical protein
LFQPTRHGGRPASQGTHTLAPAFSSKFSKFTEAQGMEQRYDREHRIGAGLVIGLAAFVLIALASFYFDKPGQHHVMRDNIAFSVR